MPTPPPSEPVLGSRSLDIIENPLALYDNGEGNLPIWHVDTQVVRLLAQVLEEACFANIILEIDDANVCLQ